jgi:thiosulfate/3-mercaptopyruvate sulfurtransferase
VEHLEGAFFVDLETQLADIKHDFSDGGRHPLPEIGTFARTLSDLGISENDHIVVYDDKHGANAAARFWWMLRSAGHEKVHVLNGGLGQAKKLNFPMRSGTEIAKKIEQPYQVDHWHLPTIDMNEVEKVSPDPNYMVIDVREKGRYDGIFEPIDLVAGHIPGAKNIPFSENLDENGLFLSPKVLEQTYSTKLGDIGPEKTIVHCGSGVTACHTLLAMAYAGMEIPKLYVGSWSEWSRNDKEIAAQSK